MFSPWSTLAVQLLLMVTVQHITCFTTQQSDTFHKWSLLSDDGPKEFEMCKADLLLNGDYEACVKVSEQKFPPTNNTKLDCKAQFGLAECLVEAACDKCYFQYVEAFVGHIDQQLDNYTVANCATWAGERPRLGCKFEWQCLKVRDPIDKSCQAQAQMKYPKNDTQQWSQTVCQFEFYYAQCAIDRICHVCQNSVVHDWILSANGAIDTDEYRNCTTVGIAFPNLTCNKSLGEFSTSIFHMAHHSSTTPSSSKTIRIIVIIMAIFVILMIIGAFILIRRPMIMVIEEKTPIESVNGHEGKNTKTISGPGSSSAGTAHKSSKVPSNA